jgi:hypoxanthine-DNA glycosylase
MNNYIHAYHEFPPVIHQDDEIIILGSFPSVKSREAVFYYMNKNNRFWKILDQIYQENFSSSSINGKIELLTKHHIALYDIIEECDIIGSSDAKIKNAVITSLPDLLKDTKIKKIYANGTKAYNLIKKYYPTYNVFLLPSSSSANAAMKLHELILEWEKLIKD